CPPGKLCANRWWDPSRKLDKLPTRDQQQDRQMFGLHVSDKLVALADEVIEWGVRLLHLLTAAYGTKRTFYACRRMSAPGREAVVQRTSAQRPILTPMVFGSTHSTCLSRP